VDGARLVPGFLAGIVLFDILLNLPGLSSASPLASLLAPSIDLLVVLALLMSTAGAGQGARTGFSVGVSFLVALVFGWQAYHTWGEPSAWRLVALCAAACAAGAASFFLSKLVHRGFKDAILRNLFLLSAAGCAVIQAILGPRIFAPSTVPAILRAIGDGFK